MLSGAHERGTSHYELLRAFVDDDTLERASYELDAHGYKTHEFGDSVLLERRAVEDRGGIEDRRTVTRPAVQRQETVAAARVWPRLSGQYVRSPMALR